MTSKLAIKSSNHRSYRAPNTVHDRFKEWRKQLNSFISASILCTNLNPLESERLTQREFLVSRQRSNVVIFLLDDDHNFTYEQIYCDTY
jgi:hypothetical protein